MPEAHDGKLSIEEIASLVSEAFPNLQCLRCKNEKFFLTSRTDHMGSAVSPTDDEQAPFDYHQMALLICGRCGYSEQHVVSFLQNADKPILE